MQTFRNKYSRSHGKIGLYLLHFRLAALFKLVSLTDLNRLPLCLDRAIQSPRCASCVVRQPFCTCPKFTKPIHSPSNAFHRYANAQRISHFCCGHSPFAELHSKLLGFISNFASLALFYLRFGAHFACVSVAGNYPARAVPQIKLIKGNIQAHKMQTISVLILFPRIIPLARILVDSLRAVLSKRNGHKITTEKTIVPRFYLPSSSLCSLSFSSGAAIRIKLH